MSITEKDNENLSDGAAEEVKTKKEIRAEKRAKLKKEKEEKKKKRLPLRRMNYRVPKRN